MPSYCVKALENTQSILCGLFLVWEHFSSGRTASHRTALDFRGIFVLLDAGGLSPAKEKRAKSTEKTGCPTCVLLLIDACKSRSFTVAANVLYLSQPTISKKIQSLENEIGVELICRKKNFVAPTPAGRYLLEEAQKIIMLADDVLQQTKRIGSGKVGAIHIGISDQLDFNGILPGFLKEFSDEEPMIDVCLSVYPYTEIPGMVAHGEIDAGFLPNVVHRPQFDGQTCIHINRTCPHLYFSSQHKMANRPNVSVEDFLNTPLYLVGGADSETMNKLRHANLCFQQVIFVESMQVLKLYLEANLGVTVLGVSQCVGSSDRICSIPLPEMDFSVGTDCIYNANDGNSSVPVFISSLKSYLKI